MSPRDVAAAHARRRARLAARARREARLAWSRVDRAAISQTWALQLPSLLRWLTGAQREAASTAETYLTTVLAAQGADLAVGPRLNPAALAGVASDGRDLVSLLVLPAIITKRAIAGGADLDRAMAAGGGLIELAAHTQVADAGRVADQVALVATPQVRGYVRLMVGKTCSRCLVLAGRHYEWNAGFLRHPQDDCIHIPAAENTPGDLRTDPKRAFAAMDRTEQDRVFTQAGAQAIRDGADMSRVVNARRGMYVAGARRFTTEATTKRGTGRKVRLMPEQIYREAAGDRTEAVRLLRFHGYLF